MICEKCGFETGPSAKFCAVCGSPVASVQMPEPAPQLEDEPIVSDVAQEEIIAVSSVDDVVEGELPVEIEKDAEPVIEEVEFESAEIPVFNSEMVAPEEQTQEDVTLPEEVPVETAPENAAVPPVYAGMPMYGVPTGQMYNGVPVYVMPNMPMYNGAPDAQQYNGVPNAQAYNGAPNAQPYNGGPNAPVYNGAPVYAPMYNVPGYGAPVQAYPGGPVYAAPVYGPQGAPVYAPGYYGAEPAKEKPKTVSILALLGSLAAIVALFLDLIKNTEVSIFKILSESLPDMLDVLEYIDRFSTFDYLVLAALGVSILCTLCAVLVFIFACLKKKCRGTSVFAMLLIIALVALFFVMGIEMYGGYVEVDSDTVLNMIKGLGVGFWLYLGGMFVGAIGGGKR